MVGWGCRLHGAQAPSFAPRRLLSSRIGVPVRASNHSVHGQRPASRLLVAVLMNVIQRTAIHHLASGHLRTITPSPFPYSFMTETTTSETKQLFKLLTKLGRGGELITTPVIRYNQCLIWAPLCFPGINDGDFGSLIGSCIA